MKIPGAHLQIVMSAQISEKSMHPSLRTCVDKIMSTDGTDRQTDGQGETNILPKICLQGGIMKFKNKE